MAETILVTGLSHKTAPLEMRERVSVPESSLHGALLELVSLPGIRESTIINTCNRVEIVAGGEDPESIRSGLRHFFREHGEVSDGWIERYVYERADRDAVRHLFRVTSSLDSLVVGEPQIVGQVKQAYAKAKEVGSTGALLNRAFHNAFSTSKRVRNETKIAESAVSISDAAVELAK